MCQACLQEVVAFFGDKLCRFAITEILSTDELLELALLGCCSTLDEFCLEFVVGVSAGGLNRRFPTSMANLGLRELMM